VTLSILTPVQNKVCCLGSTLESFLVFSDFLAGSTFSFSNSGQPKYFNFPAYKFRAYQISLSFSIPSIALLIAKKFL